MEMLRDIRTNLETRGITQDWLTYVDNNFNPEQLNILNFILNSFPEKLLYLYDPDGSKSPNEDALAIITLMSHILGNARVEINNLKYSKSIEDLYSNLANNYSQEEDRYYNNEYINSHDGNLPLLIMLAEDLKSNLLADSNLSVKEKQEIIKANQESIKDSYKLIKNRGTKASIDQVITAFLDSIDRIDDEYIVNNTSAGTGITRIILTAIDDYIDKTIDGNSGFIYPDPDGDSLFYIKTDNLLYKQLMFIKPAGMLYQILMPYADSLIFNVTNDNVTESSYNLESTVILENIDEPLVTALVADSNSGIYSINVENSNTEANLEVCIKDAFSSSSDNTFIPVYSTIINAGKSKDLVVQAQDTANEYVLAYFKSGGYKSNTKVTTLLWAATTPPDFQLVLVDLNLYAINGINVNGGYAKIKVTNTNDRPVYAHITGVWQLGGSMIRTISIPANSTSSYQVFYNPSDIYTQYINFTVYLYSNETYILTSDDAVAQVTGVYRRTDGLMEA